MKKENPVRQKSYEFAVHIVVFCRLLQQKHEYVLSKQLLRSGTSIGANIEEAQQAQSRKDFASKCNIALKESYETEYWLRLLRDTHCATLEEIHPLLNEASELTRVLAAIVKSLKETAK